MARFESIGFLSRWDICQKGKTESIDRSFDPPIWVRPNGTGGVR